MNSLAQKKCVPCQVGAPPMPLKTAQSFLKEISGWSLVENNSRIQKEFVFKNFVDAMAFLNRVAQIAEAEGHHPDFFVSYNKVRFTIFTHKINHLTESDFILAAKIDEIGLS